jgi:3-deoxy-D-manno-octulosonic-acid transferase
MIHIYKYIGIVLIPLIKLNILFRIKQSKEAANRYKERFGIPSRSKPTKKLIWIHAASVGEFKSADALINNLHKKYILLVTTTTLSAAEYADTHYKEKIIHQFAPLDVDLWIKRFLQYWKPSLVIWIESDIWPITMNLIKKFEIKAILVNVRMSPQSFNKWRKISFFYKQALECFSEIYAQSQIDQKRIEILIKREVKFIGNLKLASLKKSHLQNNNPNLTVNNKSLNIMMVSSHEGEENKFLPMIKKLIVKNSNMQIILAPRHPKRSTKIKSLCNFLQIPSRLEDNDSSNPREIVIVNSFGHLASYFELSDIVFLGGSLIPKGGHNPLEPAVHNCALITGPFIYNWQNIYEDMFINDACLITQTVDDLGTKIQELISNDDLMKKMKMNAYKYAQKKFFNTQVLLNCIEKHINKVSC